LFVLKRDGIMTAIDANKKHVKIPEPPFIGATKRTRIAMSKGIYANRQRRQYCYVYKKWIILEELLEVSVIIIERPCAFIVLLIVFCLCVVQEANNNKGEERGVAFFDLFHVQKKYMYYFWG
jgi:hypothetical protein